MAKVKEEQFQNKLHVKRSAMDLEEQTKTTEIIKKSFSLGKNEQLTTQIIKEELEKNCGGPGWNVVIGKDFGSYIFHQSKYFANFKISDLEIVIWKCQQKISQIFFYLKF